MPRVHLSEGAFQLQYDGRHLQAMSATESRYPGLTRGGGGDFKWRQIILAVALMLAIPSAIFLLTRPSTYEGPVRWGANYSTLTLVGTGQNVAVTDRTDIMLGNAQWSLEELRAPLTPKLSRDAFQAKVTYRPLGRADRSPSLAGEARSISRIP